MKNEEISQKPTVHSHSTGEAYANLARSAWEKPSGGGAAAKTESFAPPSSGSDMGGPVTSKSGGTDSVGAPGGSSADSKHGGAHEAAGSSSDSKHGQGAHKADGVGAFAPSDKGSLPTGKHNKAGGEGSHSLKPAEKKDKQDAALNFLPNLSIA